VDQIIDMKHPLAKLARTVDWSFLEERFGVAYTDKTGSAVADVACGGSFNPQAYARPFRRGSKQSPSPSGTEEDMPHFLSHLRHPLSWDGREELDLQFGRIIAPP
jgi:hypothetical protein